MRERAVVRQQDEPLGIAVEPAGRIDTRDVDVVGERATSCATGELAQDVERLVEQDELAQGTRATAPA